MKKRILVSLISCIVVGIGMYITMETRCCTATVYAQAPTEILRQEDIRKNDIESALPQTVVYDTVMNFLSSPLPEGKQEKKVLILGYDGFRYDAFESMLATTQTSMSDVASSGGLYVTYAGGDEEPYQRTDTAPGWASILTGQWDEITQVYRNGDPKAKDAETFLMQAAKQGYRSTFISSWASHFESTYQADIAKSKEEDLPLLYIQSEDDEATLSKSLACVRDTESYKKPKQIDPDILFTIFEYSDHAGHTTGFGADNAQYMEACAQADEAGKQIIEEVKNRKHYDREEWLILITTDHGGNDYRDHGGQSLNERLTWLASNIEIPTDNQ